MYRVCNKSLLLIKNIMLRIFPTLVLVFMLQSIWAQDTIVKITGRIKTDVEVMKIDTDYVYYLREKDKTVNSQGRLKPRTIERVDVFEVYYENGKSELAYQVDGEGFIVEPDSMRFYVQGCTDAFDMAHNRVIGPISFLATVGSGFLPLPFLTVVAVPAISSAVVAMFTPKFPHDKIQGDFVNRYYIMGYQDTKKIKKVKSTVFFGMSGVAFSLLFHTL